MVLCLLLRLLDLPSSLNQTSYTDLTLFWTVRVTMPIDPSGPMNFEDLVGKNEFGNSVVT